MIPFLDEQVLVKRDTFESLADDLAAYQESLEMVEAQFKGCADAGESLLLAEERAEIREAVVRLKAELATKGDSLAGVVRRLTSDLTTQKTEAKRYTAKAKATEAALKGLLEYVAGVFQEHGRTYLKTAKNTITLRKNGGVAPLVISQPDLIPDELCYFEGRLSDRVYTMLLKSRWAETKEDADEFLCAFKQVPSNTLIREQLIQPCAYCGGSGYMPEPEREIAMYQPDSVVACVTCGGTGRASVPGAHLGDRGVRLEIR